MIGQGTERRFLLVVADYPQVLPAGFEGELHRLSDGAALVGELSAANAAALRRHFPWTAPSSLHDCRTTIGCGDRLGLAGRGQLASIRKFKVKPVLAQQSKRELSMTNRSFQDVVDAADAALEIPQYGTKHSMNVSVTAGIVMWEFERQMRG